MNLIYYYFRFLLPFELLKYKSAAAAAMPRINGILLFSFFVSLFSVPPPLPTKTGVFAVFSAVLVFAVFGVFAVSFAAGAMLPVGFMATIFFAALFFVVVPLPLLISIKISAMITFFCCYS